MKKKKTYRQPMLQVVTLRTAQQLLVNSMQSTGSRQQYESQDELDW